MSRFVMGDTHREDLATYLTALDGCDVTLRMPWLKKHQPRIDWERNPSNSSPPDADSLALATTGTRRRVSPTATLATYHIALRLKL